MSTRCNLIHFACFSSSALEHCMRSISPEHCSKHHTRHGEESGSYWKRKHRWKTRRDKFIERKIKLNRTQSRRSRESSVSSIRVCAECGVTKSIETRFRQPLRPSFCAASSIDEHQTWQSRNERNMEKLVCLSPAHWHFPPSLTLHPSLAKAD